MIEYPIVEAILSGVFEKVIVSTDSEEIALISQNAGAQVIHRPSYLSADTSTMVEVCEHVLQEIVCDEFCCIYATAALLTQSLFKHSYEIFNGDLKPNYLMGVSHYNYPPVQALRRNAAGFLEYMWPEFIDQQSQAYPNLVVSNGSLVWAKTKIFLKEKTFYGSKLAPYDLPAGSCIDVDTFEDYQKLKTIIQAKEE